MFSEEFPHPPPPLAIADYNNSGLYCTKTIQ